MISLQNIAVVVAQSCPAAERDALLAFKAGITEDPSGQLTTWVATTDCCTWFGIFCKNGHVIDLELRPDDAFDNSGIYLTGPLGSSLFTLLDLELLDLSEMQNLSGTHLANHRQLEESGASGLQNQQTDRIHSFQCGQLEEAQLVELGRKPYQRIHSLQHWHHRRFLELHLLGRIFSQWQSSQFSFQLSNLTSLFLGVSYVSGSLSPLVGNLGPTLTGLDLSSNSFSGFLPATLGKLTKVFLLDLSFNKFSGQIPASIGNIGATLFNLELANNELTGPIPPMFAKQLTGLAALGLENNKLTDPIPQGAPFSNFSVDSFRPGNPGLCGHPLPPCTGGNRKKLL
ncbi:unnamed protein product [Sphagnum tenellum]